MSLREILATVLPKGQQRMNCVFDSTADFYDATWFTPVFCYSPAQRFWQLHNLLMSGIFGGFNSIEKSPLSTYFVFRGTSNAGPPSLLLQTFKVCHSFRQLVSGWHIFELASFFYFYPENPTEWHLEVLECCVRPSSGFPDRFIMCHMFTECSASECVY